jgi:hypothetical protein
VRVLLCATLTATRDLRFKVISERPVIITSECRVLGKGAITIYFKRLGFDAAGTSGARTHDRMLNESTTTNITTVKFEYKEHEYNKLTCATATNLFKTPSDI